MSLKSMIRTHLSTAFLIPALVVGVTACTTNEPQVPSGIFYLLNVNPATAGAVGGVQMRIDEQPIFGTSIQFGNANGDAPIREGDVPYQVSFTSGTGTTVLADTNVQVYRDSVYFFVLARDAVNASLSQILLFKNTASLPESDEAKLRFVHTATAIPGATAGVIGAVDIYVTAANADLATATPLFANLQYGEVRDHKIVPPPTDTLLLRITKAGDRVSTPLLTKKYTTKSDGSSTLPYLGAGSLATMFIINSVNSPYLLPVSVFQVGTL